MNKTILGPSLAVLITGSIAHADVCRVDDDSTALSPDGASWATSYLFLQDALADANCTEIWVAAGVYYPDESTAGGDTDDRTATFALMSGIAIYGGFNGGESNLSERDWNSNVTVLSGDIDNNDITLSNGVIDQPGDILGNNAYHVVIGSGTDSTARLDGVVVTAGRVNFAAPDAAGAGVYNYTGSPTLANVTISGNIALHGGGMFNSFSDPTLANVKFLRNAASGNGGGMFNVYSNPTLTNVSFEGNDALDGGGISNALSSPSLVNVSFVGNIARHPYKTGDGRGGALYCVSSSPTLINGTLVGNTAERFGGSMSFSSCSPTLINVILYGNTAPSGPEIFNINSTPDIGNSLIQGSGGSGPAWDPTVGADLGNNLDDDPLFSRLPDPGADGIWGTPDDDYGDLRLQAGSPAIDAGDIGALPADTQDLDGDGDTTESIPLDLDGNARVVGAAVDLGAYESSIPGPTEQPISFRISGTVSFLSDDSNLLGGSILEDDPFSAFLTYDANRSDTHPDDPNRGTFPHAPPTGVNGLSLTAGGLTFLTDPAAQLNVNVWNDRPLVVPSIDQFDVNALNSLSPDVALDSASIWMNLQTPDLVYLQMTPCRWVWTSWTGIRRTASSMSVEGTPRGSSASRLPSVAPSSQSRRSRAWWPIIPSTTA